MLQKTSVVFLFLSLFFSSRYVADAVSIKNDSYKIENIEIQEGKFPVPTQPPLENAPSITLTYPYGQASISQSINPTDIEYGSLNPGEPILRTQDIIVSKNKDLSATLFAGENHPLQSTTSASIQIPDTTCDEGTCTSTIPSQWTNLLTFGLGFRCDGKMCASDFSDKNSYESFSHIATGFSPVLSLANLETSAKSVITYKVNTAPSTTSGVKGNTIQFILVSGF